MVTGRWILGRALIIMLPMVSIFADESEESAIEEVQVIITGQQGLKVETSTSTSKFELPLLDIPQSITVIPDKLLQSQQPESMAEVLKNDASISNIGSFRGIRQRFSARGFELSARGNYLRNGRIYWFYDMPATELLERVDIIKGPAALYGQSSPGATINMVTKMPVKEPIYAVEAGAGSYDDYKLHADLGGAINETMAYRANLVWRDSDSFRDHIFIERKVASLSVDWNSNDNALVNFYADITYDKRPQDSGLVAIGSSVANIPRSRVLNAPWAINDMSTLNVGTTLDYYINDNWQMDAGFNFQHFERDRTDAAVRGLDQTTGDYSLRYQRRLDNWRYYTTNIDLINDNHLLNQPNQFVIGVDYVRSTYAQQRTYSIDFTGFNIYRNNLFPEAPNLPLQHIPGTSVNNVVGVYMQDVLSLSNQWDVMAGLRYDMFHSSPRTGSGYTDTHLTPKVGVLYKFTPNISTYVSYLQSFEPNGPVSGDYVNEGQRLKPTIGHQVEMGIKSDISSQIGVTFAGFYIIRKNQLTVDRDNNDDRLVQRGQQKHQGLEASLVGQVTDNLQLFTQAMYLDAKITQDTNASLVGNTPYGAPKWSSSVWGEYRLPASPDWRLSLGIFYEGKRQGNDDNSFTLEPYARFDLGLEHRKKWNTLETILHFNIDNVFDKVYFHSSDETNITVGAPRIFKASLRVLFN